MEHVYDGSRIIFDRIRKTVKLVFQISHLLLHRSTDISTAQLDRLKKQIHIERDAELITFYLEDDAVITYCM